MKKLYFLFVMSLLSSSFMFAQKISGGVALPDGKPADFATVLLLNAKDSSLAKSAATDLDGNYELVGVKMGTYFLSFSYLGYEKTFSKVFNYDGTDYAFEKIPLQAAKSSELAQVSVVARKPLLEIKADRTIMNVEAMISSAGSNGLELLRKAPGVMIDNNENIQLRGKNGVIVQLDGKQTYMTSQDLANLLKGLNANDIEAIEIITNPSAKYDASGNAGIINIRLKKNKNIGTNGSINLNTAYGIGPKNGASINLNNRSKKFNVFGNAGVSSNENYNGLDMYRTQDGKNFDQQQRQVSIIKPLNIKFGTDYFINSKQTIGFLANANTFLTDNDWKSTSKVFISQAGTPTKIDSTLNAENNIIGNRINANFNLNYRYVDTLGNELTMDVDRGLFRSKSRSEQPNQYVYGTEGATILQRSFKTITPSNIDIMTAKIDYERKIGKKGASFALGLKYANVVTTNTFDFYNVINNQDQRDIQQSNRFTYSERVNAAYLNGNVPFSKKLSLQAGLRYEQTKSEGNLTRDPSQPIKTEDRVPRNYGNLFPSAALTYELSAKHSFNLSYSRRIDRPSYEDLNPFEWRLDELTFRKGSPFLKPQFSDNYEAKYTFMGFASLSAGYSKTTDLITDIVERDPKVPNKSFINYRNLSMQDNYSLSLGTPTPIKKWWNGYVSITMYKAIYTANFTEYTFKAATPLAWNLYAEQTFSLPKGFTSEISGWYNSASIWGGSWLSKPQGSLDMGLQKKILKDKATLKLSATDLFHTAPWRSFSDAIPGLIIKGSGFWESQQVKLNFNYRFGNNNVKSARQRKTGLEDEKNRIKN